MFLYILVRRKRQYYFLALVFRFLGWIRGFPALGYLFRHQLYFFHLYHSIMSHLEYQFKVCVPCILALYLVKCDELVLNIDIFSVLKSDADGQINPQIDHPLVRSLVPLIINKDLLLVSFMDIHSLNSIGDKASDERMIN